MTTEELEKRVEALELLALGLLDVFTHFDYKGRRHYGGCDRDCICEERRIVLEPLLKVLTEKTP